MSRYYNKFYFNQMEVEQETQIESFDEEYLKEINLAKSEFIYKDNIGNISYTEKQLNSNRSRYEVKAFFEGKKSLNKNEIVINTIQTILNESKKELIKCEVSDIIPMAFLLSKYNVDLIKKISSENFFTHNEVYKTIISEVFDKNLINTLNMAISKLKEKKE